MNAPIHPLIQNAYSVLDGRPISRETALAIAKTIHGADPASPFSLVDLVNT